jgi:hypothetical protein
MRSAATASLLDMPNLVRRAIRMASVVPSPPGGIGMNVARREMEYAANASKRLTSPPKPP